MDESASVQSYGDILDLDIPPARPVIEGLVNEGEGVILAGPPGVGKTWVELSMASAIATGESWVCHFPTTRGAVLIIDEESHIRGLQSRIAMMENAHPIGYDAPIYFAIGSGARLDTPEGMAAVDVMLSEYDPSVVFLDSFTRMHGANENSSGEMAGVFRNAKALMRAHNTCFIFLDHVRKKSLLNDPEEMLRGSTEKRAWPDSIIYLSPVEKGTTQVSHVKCRFSEKVEDFRIRLDIDGESAKMVYDGSAPSLEGSRANDIVEAIHDLQRQLGPDGADATTIAAWMNCSHDTVTRHSKRMVTAGILKTRTIPPTERGGRGKTVFDVRGGF